MNGASSSSAACRIVVVSSSLDTSREVALRIKALSGDTSASPGPYESGELIYWTISNKYYIAPVHFHPISLETLELIELDDVPAVIYAWKENEPYRKFTKQVAEQIASCSPEVQLAVSLAPTTDEQLEDFFFEHGFEYVEGHTDNQDKSADRFDPSATPGMHRVVDALSTIMWPTMSRFNQKPCLLTTPPGKAEEDEEEDKLEDEDDDEVDLDYRALTSHAAGDSKGKSSMQRELEMFERWLEEDDEDYKENTTSDDENSGYASLESHEQSFSNDPWRTTTPGIPTNAEGFDDDFTEFVSAPPPAPDSNASRPEPELDEDSDSDLPSKAEIQATSTRIFGRRPTGPDSSHTHTDTAGDKPGLESVDLDMTGILSALDAMKEEVSSIGDTRERRRAAARVALGFVYGLEETNGELDAAAARVA